MSMTPCAPDQEHCLVFGRDEQGVAAELLAEIESTRDGEGDALFKAGRGATDQAVDPEHRVELRGLLMVRGGVSHGRVPRSPLEVERRFSDPIRLESGCESSDKGEKRRGETLSHHPQE
jgi:hypothetical protein